MVPVFVLDPALIATSGGPRLAFLYRTLRALNASLDGNLVVRSGDPAVEIPALVAELGVEEVHVTRDFGPYGRDRDQRVAQKLAGMGARLVGHGSPYAVAPGVVRKGDGQPYAVFTPFFRAWQRELTVATPANIPVRWHDTVNIACDALPTEPPIGCQLPAASEDAAHEQLDRFLTTALDRYPDQRDLPAIGGTSGLSPYLRWGVLHPHQLLIHLGDSVAHQLFRSELAWRDFYADVLHHHPASARRNLQSKMDAMDVDSDDAARARFDLWCHGRTGFPIVDAGMRQLLATGWMHNRVRMIVASFLVKDLHLPWQWGARHFMQHLVDGDLASNQHGWQWAAGTGTDAAPYFRVFNPVTQSERFDRDGTYIRRWVPELVAVTGKAIHAPWLCPTGLPEGAQEPMVDHALERDVALSRYQRAMGR